MEVEEFALRVTENLPFNPNGQQIGLIAALARFCSPAAPDNMLFLLNGYAGTGKTSVTAALVKTLRQCGVRTVLLAPTGRAAKVFSGFAGMPAYTIHRWIYRHGSAANPVSTLATNQHSDTIFVVDEASMIGDEPDSGYNSLLSDLMEYVYSGDNCRLILMGDTAQLPPVGSPFSPAMDLDTLRGFGLRITRVTLTQTVRQASDSGILYNATRLRKVMRLDQLPEPTLKTSGFSDIEAVDPQELQDYLETAYCAEGGIDNTLVITRSNRRALAFNMQIRRQVLEYEEMITVGERLLIARNNYLWSADVPGLSFIANGDIAEIVRIYGMEDVGQFQFADIRLRFPDKDGLEIDAKINLTCLLSETATMTQGQMGELFGLLAANAGVNSNSAAQALMRNNPYFNALQVKYAYAVTCHKAQGGQWKRVFVDLGYIAPEALTSIDLYRWLYTSLTRATEEVYLINSSINIV